MKSNIWKLYAYWFFHSLIFAYVIERLYWLQRGISIKQVVYLEFIYSAAVIILEVPTGVMADKWSRKNMMILSAVFTFFEFFILIFAGSFLIFALAIVSAAIARALSSGTSNAIFYDSLKILGKEEEFEKVIGRNSFFDRLSGIIAALAGSFIAWKISLVSTYWFSLISILLSLIFSMILKEPGIKTITSDDEYWKHTEEAYRFFLKNHNIVFLVIYGAVIMSVLVYVDEFWQIYLKMVKIPVIYFGVFSVLCFSSAGISGMYSYKIKNRFSYKVIFSLVVFCFSISLMIAGYLSSKAGIVFLFLAYSVSGVIEPLVSGYLHHRAESKYRATVESFQSLVLKFSALVAGLIFGFFSERYSIFTGYKLLGLLVFLYGIYYVIFQFKFVRED